MSRHTGLFPVLVLLAAGFGLSVSAQAADPVVVIVGGRVQQHSDLTILLGSECTAAGCTDGIAPATAAEDDPTTLETALALIAAAKNDGVGLTGVCPRCRIVNIVVDTSVSTDPDQAEASRIEAKRTLKRGIEKAVTLIKDASPDAIKKGVILLSYDGNLGTSPTNGGTDELKTLLSAIYNRSGVASSTNIVVVAGSGNGEPVIASTPDGTGESLFRYPTDKPSYPCAYGYDVAPKSVVCAGSLDTLNLDSASQRRRSTFSNYGEWVDVWAPGQNIPFIGVHGEGDALNRTRASAAIIAAVVAKLQDDASNNGTPLAVRNTLLTTDAIEAEAKWFYGAP